ncbi:CYTH and CHAD domain-containing protein [Actinocorallia longicatena]|uniref:CYTH and CHAD domain-containing protein n=1 Tax=Actinocorallia longicatena TaxID=111803 RepID=A0ABP6QJD0_9ACTN
MGEHLEIELKFDADAAFVPPDLSDLAEVSDPQVHRLEAVYYDTASLALAARKVTLRRRTGGPDEGWHLKLPAGPDAKREHRAPLSGSLPAELAELVTAYTRGAELVPVATLSTVRTVREVVSADGTAELADDLVTGSIEGTPGTESWREIEIEVVTGEKDQLAPISARLLEAGASRAATSSKLGRLLAPRITALPAWDGTAAGEAVVRYLAGQVADLLYWDPRVRREEYDAVHKMRVAVRRLRSVLKSAGPVVDRGVTDRLQPELSWLADVLGEVRDAEVLHERFAARLDSLPQAPSVAPAWLDEIKARESAGYDRIRAELSGGRYFALLDALEALLESPPLTPRAKKPAVKELPRLLRRSWRRVERAHAAIADAPDAAAGDEAHHDTRKAAKRARYTADATREVLGDQAKAVSRAAKCLQEVLGRFQDGVIAQEALLAATPATPADGFLLGTLYGLERAEVTTALAEVEAAWTAARAQALPALA